MESHISAIIPDALLEDVLGLEEAGKGPGQETGDVLYDARRSLLHLQAEGPHLGRGVVEGQVVVPPAVSHEPLEQMEMPGLNERRSGYVIFAKYALAYLMPERICKMS